VNSSIGRRMRGGIGIHMSVVSVVSVECSE
jgi:hypothetical protein